MALTYEQWLEEKIIYLDNNNYGFEEAEETQRLIPNYQKAADVTNTVQTAIIEDLLCYIAFLEICIDKHEQGKL